MVRTKGNPEGGYQSKLAATAKKTPSLQQLSNRPDRKRAAIESITTRRTSLSAIRRGRRSRTDSRSSSWVPHASTKTFFQRWGGR